MNGDHYFWCQSNMLLLSVKEVLFVFETQRDDAERLSAIEQI